MRLKFLTIGVFIFLMSAPFLQLSAQFGNLPNHENTSSDLYSQNDNGLRLLSTAQDTQITKFRMRKSPTLAVLLSAVIPGAGQFYNQSYWKIPVIAGLSAYFGYEYINNNNKFKDYRDQYNSTITPENPFGNQNLKTLREFYRNQRDDFVWYFLIVYVVNLVDAYVDAHLFDFDVKEEKLVQYGKTDKTYLLKLNLKF